MTATPLDHIQSLFDDSIAVKQASRDAMGNAIARAGELLVARLRAGNKVLACGNGGSAADSQHFAAELINRFETERSALPAIALTTDSSNLTAIGNDYSYQRVFSRQVEALGQQGDLLLAISTSGNSGNVLEAIRVAQAQSVAVIALSGGDGGEIARQLSDQDVELRVPDTRTARIQEVHILILHCLCSLVDQAYA